MPRGMYKRPTLEQRFWANVDTSAGLFGCWPWIGVRNPKGYGKLWVDVGNVPATHVALELAGRPLVPGEVACHSCDNPPCVNPAHLFAGTQAENIADRDSKGHTARGERNGRHTHPERTARGERNGLARLTADAARQIAAASTDISTTELAREFGVSRATVSDIRRGRTWRHVA